MKINKNVITKIKRELKSKVEANYRENSYGFYKKGERVKILGVRNKFVRKIAAKYFLEIKKLPLNPYVRKPKESC